jgi:pyruvate, water dikinase
MRKNLLFLKLLIIVFPVTAFGQTVYSGKIIDSYTKNPVSGAEISFQGTNLKTTTDSDGRFSLATGIDDINNSSDFEIDIEDERVLWRSNKPMDIQIINILGQSTEVNGRSLIGNGELDVATLPDGIYLMSVECKKAVHVYKMNKNSHFISIGTTGEKPKSNLKSTLATDTIVISKSGYFTQKYGYQTDDNIYELLKLKYDNIDYLNRLIRPEAFTILQGMPFNSTFSEVKSIKLVYSIPDQKMYYSNSEKYAIHYDFCSGVLGYNKGQTTFNREQYSKNANRIYILATLNHFTASGIYTLEFLAADQLDCSDIETVYNKVAETFYLGESLRFYANSTDWATCKNVPVISSDELYKGQNYQPLNPQENYGYLRKVSATKLSTTYLGRHDIVLLSTIPIDIPVVSGIITTEFQTPLSHINVLSHNRGTPNMALRDGWTNPKLNGLLDKLVYLKVSLDSFNIHEAILSEAQIFWAQKEPQTIHVLKLDTTTTGLVELTVADVNWVSTIGGKAANFAELTNVDVPNYGPLPLPENYFAIPFYYYCQHIKRYGLDVFINNMLNDQLFRTDISYRKQQLEILHDSIKNSPLDAGLLQLVKAHLANTEGFTNFRFRSSTNAEDIEGFNGAGLYESFTGSLSDPDKPIDKAIKKVWASLWDYGAFEERDYFKIDHRTIAMGVLVHRSYPAEAANGVAITENIYNPYHPAVTINVQVGEISVVSPEENQLPDQILFYTNSDESIIEYINHSNVPGMEGKTVMTNNELKELKDYCMAINYHYCKLNLECSPMDIEFKVDVIKGVRKVYIKQARLY